MRILMVHNRYRIRGGEDESTGMETALLRSHGHEVVEYTEENEQIAELSSWRVAFRTIWSQQSYRRLRRLIREQRPHLACFQNLFPLISPAAYYAAKAEGLPTVQMLRNYRLLCPNALLFRQGRPCEDCLQRLLPWPGILHACYRDNRRASAAVATMLTTHRALRTWKRRVNMYVALTEFGRQKFIQGGFAASKIMVKPNFVYPDPKPGDGPRQFAIFAGRLFPEKGVDTLLDAWERLPSSVPLKIVGEGPAAERIMALCERVPEIEWLGRKPLADVYELMGQAHFLIFPSKWYEGLGRTIIEAFAKGTPVLASNLGSMAALIEHGRTGLHFEPGNADDLAAKIAWAWSHPVEMAAMGQAARREFEAKYTAERNYAMTMEIYQRAMGQPIIRPLSTTT